MSITEANRYTPEPELGVRFDDLDLESTGPHSGYLRQGGAWYHIKRKLTLGCVYLKAERLAYPPIRTEAQMYRWLDE